LSGAFSTAERWEWITRNPAESARPPTVTRRPVPATPPGDVAKVIAEGRKTHPDMALYLWLAAITGARRGELCALQVRDLDLDNSVLHLAFNYIVVDGRRVRKDTKTHQDRYLAIDPVTCTMLREHLEAIRAELAAVGAELPEDAYVFSNDPMGANPWNPDWATHKASDLAARLASSSTSRGCGTTRRANCLRDGSTCAILRRVSVTAAAGPPRSGITLTLFLRLTDELPSTSHS
jgi:integrase